MRFLRTVMSWILALLIAFVLIQLTLHPLGTTPPGAVKFYDLPGEHIVFETLADRSGAASFEPAGRLVAGVLELIAALALILPFTRRLGAWLVVLVMGVGSVLHLSPLLGRTLPVSTDPMLIAGDDGGRAFFVTLALLVGAVLILLVHAKRARRSRER